MDKIMGMKSTFAKFIDDLFLAAAVFLLAALIALYFVEQLYLCIIIAVIVAMAVTFLFRIRDRKNKQAVLDKAGAETAERHFLFNDDEYALNYCFSALKKRYAARLESSAIRINDTIVAPCLTEPLSLKKVVYFYSLALKNKAKTLVIPCFRTEKFPFDLKSRLSGLRLEIFAADKTYQLLKSLNSLPPEGEKLARRRKFSEFLAAALSPKRAKAYLFTVFALLFSAYFSMMSIYFIVMSAVCLTLVILCKLDIYQKFVARETNKNY